jgi:hypothetical protein
MADGFASLTSGLLARKGQARPAMRPQGFAGPTAGLEDLGWNDMGHDQPRPIGVRLPSHLSGPQAAVPAVVRQQEELAAAVEAVEAAPFAPDAPVEQAAPAPVEVEVEAEPVSPLAVEPAPVAVLVPIAAPAVRRAAPKKAEPVAASRAEGRKAAFTLRLDAGRHLRLRLACAVQNRSAQQLVIEALDALLGDMPDVDRLAQSLPATKN